MTDTDRLPNSEEAEAMLKRMDDNLRYNPEKSTDDVLLRNLVAAYANGHLINSQGY